MSLENHQMYTNFHIKLLIKSACFPWSQLRTEIHKTFCSSSFFPFCSLALLFSSLPRCLLELSLESDLYYLSLTLSPQLCLFLSLNGDLDKRVWAARKWSLHTKRQTKRTREKPEWRASESQIYWAICTLFQTHPVARKLHASASCLSGEMSLLFVCLLASLYENYQAEFHKIWVKGEAWAKE